MSSVRLEPPSSPPNVDDEQNGGGGRGWVELFRAANDIDAALLIGMLADRGIDTHTIKDRSQANSWLYGGSNPWAPVLVYVRRVHLIDARIVLAEISLATADMPPAREDEYSRRRVPRMWWATALALGLALSSLALLQLTEQERFCQLPVLCGDSGAP